jgi:sec-independent protein translocase protein TatB
VSFGLTFDKLLIIAIIAVFLLGPDRLPYYASQLARLVKSLRAMANGAKDRMREEMGPDFDDIDWKKLDPRQYDPRRIIREALIDDDPPTRVRPPAAAAAGAAAEGDLLSTPQAPRPESAYAQRQRKLSKAAGPPHDSEAT